MNWNPKYFVGYIDINPNTPKAAQSGQIYTLSHSQFDNLPDALAYRDVCEKDWVALRKYPSMGTRQYDVFILQKIT